MKRNLCLFLLVVALVASGLSAQKPKQSAGDVPINVCATVYNPTPAFVVPADSKLVIEDASVSARVDPGEFVVGVIETTAGQGTAEHYVGKVSGDDFLFMRDGRIMKVYADPDTTVVFKAARRNAPTDIEICFSGHLEPAGGQ